MSENYVGQAIKRVCHDLGLPSGDGYTQDWAYELPESFRTPEYLLRYVDAYSTPTYGDDEKQILMQLMLDVANDLLEADEQVGQDTWARLVPLLRANRALHREQIEYWAQPDSALEDAFRLSALAREFLAQS